MFDNDDVIHSYTRRDAIEDGVLVDLSQGEFGKMAKEAGFKWPFAMTQTAFYKFVERTEAARMAGNDVQGRWWDILTMLRHAIAKDGAGSQLIFEFMCVVDKKTPELCRLKAVVGPGDSPEPCFTLMLPDED